MWAYIIRRHLSGKGKGAGLVLPWRDTAARQDHLAEISRAVYDGAYAVLILDRAGWHVTPKFKVPDNNTMMFPPRSPELNPVENVWQSVRHSWLPNRSSKTTTISSPIAALHGSARRSAVAQHAHRTAPVGPWC